jgi:hypothetical protein
MLESVVDDIAGSFEGVLVMVLVVVLVVVEWNGIKLGDGRKKQADDCTCT